MLERVLLNYCFHQMVSNKKFSATLAHSLNENHRTNQISDSIKTVKNLRRRFEFKPSSLFEEGKLWSGKRRFSETCYDIVIFETKCDRQYLNRPFKRVRRSDYVPKKLERMRNLLSNPVTSLWPFCSRPNSSFCSYPGIPIRRQNCQIMMNMRNEALYI